MLLRYSDLHYNVKFEDPNIHIIMSGDDIIFKENLIPIMYNIGWIPSKIYTNDKWSDFKNNILINNEIELIFEPI